MGSITCTSFATAFLDNLRTHIIDLQEWKLKTFRGVKGNTLIILWESTRRKWRTSWWATRPQALTLRSWLRKPSITLRSTCRVTDAVFPTMRASSSSLRSSPSMKSPPLAEVVHRRYDWQRAPPATRRSTSWAEAWTGRSCWLRRCGRTLTCCSWTNPWTTWTTRVSGKATLTRAIARVLKNFPARRAEERFRVPSLRTKCLACRTTASRSWARTSRTPAMRFASWCPQRLRSSVRSSWRALASNSRVARTTRRTWSFLSRSTPAAGRWRCSCARLSWWTVVCSCVMSPPVTWTWLLSGGSRTGSSGLSREWRATPHHVPKKYTRRWSSPSRSPVLSRANPRFWTCTSLCVWRLLARTA